MAAPVTQLGFTITPPTKEGFGGAPWKQDANLAMLADRVMNKHPERFRVARDFSIAYLWRAKGGTSRGEPKFADCLKLGGLAYHFSEADFVIWLAADHLADYGFKDLEFEALMFRQLMHIGSNENTGSAVLVPFDFKGFNAELVEYGPWDEALRKMSHTLQPTLFSEAGDEETVEDDSPSETEAEVEALAADGIVVPFPSGELPADPEPSEKLPTEDLAAQFMSSNGWSTEPLPTVTESTGEHPYTEADQETEREFAASRSGRRRGTE